MTEEKTKKTIQSCTSAKKAQAKGLFVGASPKVTFLFGLVVGLAVFSLLSLVLLSLIIFAPRTEKKVSTDESQQITKEIEEEAPVSAEKEVNKFKEKEGSEICKENGKPIIRLFSTTWCSYCSWIKDTFDQVAKEYVNQGKIVAYHWEVDTNDNTLTEEVEKEIPEKEMAVYQEFNPRGSIPTFVFGCKYWRIGIAYDDLAKEEVDFRETIDALLE